MHNTINELTVTDKIFNESASVRLQLAKKRE